MSNSGLIVALGLLTLGHAGLQYLVGDSDDQRPKLVSSLEADAPIPPLPGFDFLRGTIPAGRVDSQVRCQLLVAFDPTCPQCWKAARVRAGIESESVPVTWLAMEPRADAGDFELAIPLRDRVLQDPRVWKALQVNAVPAAFLIRSDRTLARVWPFSGRERDSDLQEWCSSSFGELVSSR